MTEDPRIPDKENIDNGSYSGAMLEEDSTPAPKRFKFSDELK